VRTERRGDVAAAILTVLGTAPDIEISRWSRSSLFVLGYDLFAAPPTGDAMRNYQAVLLQRETFADLWNRVGQVRTYSEQIQAYVTALERGEAAPADYPDLPSAASDVWLSLEKAFKSPQYRKRLVFMKGLREACPVDHVNLPRIELEKLKKIGIATAKNCCGRVIIRTEA
jgi:hypothetical protein